MIKEMKKRKGIRLSQFDYSTPGTYFITVCTDQRKQLFGRISNAKFEFSKLGKLVQECWQTLPTLNPIIVLDQHQVMPNHFHGLLTIKWKPGEIFHPSSENQHSPGTKSSSISSAIQSFKSMVTRKARRITPGICVWQRGFFDHVVRDENGLEAIRDYIENNPAQWNSDRENPNHKDALQFYGWLEAQGTNQLGKKAKHGFAPTRDGTPLKVLKEN